MTQLQGNAVLEGSTNSIISGNNSSSSKMPKFTRTATSSTKSGKCDHKNLIPDNYAQTIQIVNGIECFVSQVLSDPLYRIHTITESESED
jgi:hypothetical protein